MSSKKARSTLLVRLIVSIKNEKDMQKLLSEVFSPAELDRANQRIETTKALLKGNTYRSIEKQNRTSTYVIYRASRNIVNSPHGLVKKSLKQLGELDD